MADTDDMQDHIRQRMLDAAVAKLTGDCPLFGGRVWLAPRPPASKKEMPLALVFQGSEQTEYATQDDRNQKRFLDFEVLVADMITRGAEATTVLKVLNRAAAQVEKCLLASFVDDRGLGLGELDLFYLGTDNPRSSALGDDVAEMAIKFRVVFLTLEGDPTNTTNEFED